MSWRIGFNDVAGKRKNSHIAFNLYKSLSFQRPEDEISNQRGSPLGEGVGD